MKTLLNKLLTIAVMASLVLVYSCTEDGETDGSDLDSPSLVVTATVGSTGAAFTSGGTIAATDSIVFSFQASTPQGFNVFRASGDVIQDLEITRNDIGASATEASPTLPALTAVIPEASANTTISFDFELVDEQVTAPATASISVAVGDVPSPAVDSFTETLVGGFQNTVLGSFYDAIEDSVYFFSDATDNSGNIDLVYYFVGTAGIQNTIGALDNMQTGATLEEQINGSNIDTNFPTQNSTRFQTYLVAPDFDAVETLADLQDAFDGDTELSAQERITDLQMNDVIGFTLAASRESRIGLIRVADISGTDGSNRQIQIDVKIAPALQ